MGEHLRQRSLGIDMGGINHDGVGGFLEWGDAAAGIPRIPRQDIGQHL